MKMRSVILAIGCCAVITAPAFAHHSFAMFDADKKVTLDGTIKEFQWTNPHAWMVVMVPNAQGAQEQWAIEMGPAVFLARQGWLPKTVVPGMKVSAIIHPLKDGTHGGQFMAVTLPDGKMMGNPNARPNAGGG
jgi:hypothetical protein